MTFATPLRRRVAVLIVVLAALAVYARTYTFELVWDDPLLLSFIEKRFQEQGFAGVLAAQFQIDPAEESGFYRPVVSVSLWVDTRLASRFPGIYHLTNILLHAAVSLAVFFFISRVSGSGLAAFLGALCFAVHPAQSEAVAFVSGRTDLWAALFGLVAALAWAKGRPAAAAPSPLVRWGGLAAFALATLSKEVAYLLPAVLLAWDTVQPGSNGEVRRSWWGRNRFWLPGWAAVLGAGIFLRWAVAGIPFGFGSPAGKLATDVHLLEYPQLLPLTVATYLRLLSIPWPLNSFYTASEIGWNFATLAGAGLTVGICLLVAGKKHLRAGLFSLIWIGCFLLPVLKLVPAAIGAILAERFLYLPAVGFCLALGMALDRLARHPRWRAPAFLATGALVVALSAGTVARQSVWRNPVTLFQDQMRTTPSYVDPYNNLGSYYYSVGKYPEATALFERAVALAPEFEMAYMNLGNARLRLRQIDQAIDAFQRVTRLNPASFPAHFSLGNAFQRAGRNAEAAASYERALQLRPDDQESRNNLWLACLAAGDYAKAKEILVRSGALDSVLSFRFSHGLHLASQGREKEALAEYAVLKGLGSARAEELLRAINKPR